MFWKRKKKKKKYREERNLKLIRDNHFRYCKINLWCFTGTKF